MFLEKNILPLTQIDTIQDAINHVRKHFKNKTIIREKNIFIMFIDQLNFARHTFWFPFGRLESIDFHMENFIEISKSTGFAKIWIITNRTNGDCTGHMIMVKASQWNNILKTHGITLQDLVVLGHLKSDKYSSMKKVVGF